MSDDLIAKVQVIPVRGKESEAGSLSPKDFTEQSLQQIAHVINRSVGVLKEQLDVSIEQVSQDTHLSEIELAFGIDFEAKSNIPIIGPILGAGVRAGTTFQVHIKLVRGQPDTKPSQ